jgi:hypothetical protein
VMFPHVSDFGSGVLSLPAECDLDRHAGQFLDSHHVLPLLASVSKSREAFS